MRLSGPLVVTPLAHGAPEIEGCPIFPADNAWNTPVDHLPVHAMSDDYVATIGAGTGLKADFGSGSWNGGPIGIPFDVVNGSQNGMPISFNYASESDPGPYPIPAGAAIEGGAQSSGDRHVLVLEKDNCILYELFAAYPQNGSWSAGSGAVFDLRSNNLRPDGWTSADAAGLPVLPGLVRYDEVAAGEIQHALRFTVPQTQRAYVWPGRHFASSNTAQNLPPMGLRMRLKADFDISGFSPQIQVILRALKKYGMLLSDNGSAWFMSGVPDERWDNDMLQELRNVPGSALEAVDTSLLQVAADSARVAPIAADGNLNPASLTLKTLLQPGSYSQVEGQIFLAVIWHEQILFHNGNQWLEYTDGTYPHYSSGPLSHQSIVLFDNLDARPYPGAQIFAGFGLNANDMLVQENYRLLFQVP